MSKSRHLWTRDLLAELGVRGTIENAIAIVAQCQAEGGEAAFNPLNCTVRRPGSTNYNSVPVQNYASYAQGLEATASMLRQSNMKGLLAQLTIGTSSYNYWMAVATSPWGTKPPEGYSIATWLQDVRDHWFDRAMQPIAGT